MDYNVLIDLAADFGYALSVSGAETYRVEDTICRILQSYQTESEIFAIPNLLIVNIKTDDGTPVTRLRRIGPHGTNLDAVERLNALSRHICAANPSVQDAVHMLEDTIKSVPVYGPRMILLGNFLGALGFALLFGCGLTDMIIAGFCGVISGLSCFYSSKYKVNFFYSTLFAAFFLSFSAYGLQKAGLVLNTDGVVIGALMTLVPGLLFTNSMRDVIYRDTNSGINRLVEVVITAVALALGTAVAWNAAVFFWGTPGGCDAIDHSLFFTTLGALIGCIGFSIVFNIHGPGGVLCALGGMLAWVVFSLTGGDIMGYFWASVTAAAYAEIMARIRKYPTISYLVVSLFPLMPGAGVYYTMYYAVHGDLVLFAAKGTETASIAGVLAVGVMLVSTIVQFIHVKRNHA